MHRHYHRKFCIFSAHLSIVNKVSTVLNLKSCNPHHQRHDPSRDVRTTGGARAPAQDYLALILAYYLLHWMLWGGWIDDFIMYIHAFDKKSKFSLAGSLVKLIYSLVTCVNQKNSKTRRILMIELAETRKEFSAAPFAMEQIKKLRCTSPPFLLLKSDYWKGVLVGECGLWSTAKPSQNKERKAKKRKTRNRREENSM